MSNVGNKASGNATGSVASSASTGANSGGVNPSDGTNRRDSGGIRAGATIVNPAEHTSGDGTTAGTDAPKRRGRKPGTRNKAKSAAFSVDAVSQTLVGIHTALVAITKVPELAIDKAEADMLSSAIGNVQRHYPIKTTEKAMDWTNLFICCFGLYSVRYFAIRNRKKANKPQGTRANSQAKPEPVEPGEQPYISMGELYPGQVQ